MKRFSYYIMLMVVLSTVPALAAELPAWSVGQTYTVDQHYAGSANFTGGSAVIDITSSGCPWIVTAAESFNLQKCGATVDIYKVQFDCNVVATGHASLTDPITLDADIKLENVTFVGTMLVRRNTLNIVRIDLDLVGDAYAFLFGNWTSVGTASATVHAEACPELGDFEWPLEVGNTWNTNTTFYAWGEYIADLNIFGVPYVFEGTFDEALDLAYSASVAGMEAMNGCNSFKVAMTESTGLGSMTNHYCPDWGWYSRKTITDLNMEGITLEEVKWDMTGNAIPTPTPTPPAGDLGIELEMPASDFAEGDPCYLKAFTFNNEEPLSNVQAFVFLDIGIGEYWFAPSWTKYPPNIDSYFIDVPVGDKEITPQPISNFNWPGGAGVGGPFTFWGAMLNDAGTAVRGDLGSFNFRFH